MKEVVTTITQLQRSHERTESTPSSGVRRQHEEISPTSVDLHYDSGHEFVHLAWGVDLGLVEPSSVASLIYTLTDRGALRGGGGGGGGGGAWVWRYEGRHVEGTELHWPTEEETRGSFAPVRLDISSTRCGMCTTGWNIGRSLRRGVLAQKRTRGRGRMRWRNFRWGRSYGERSRVLKRGRKGTMQWSKTSNRPT